MGELRDGEGGWIDCEQSGETTRRDAVLGLFRRLMVLVLQLTILVFFFTDSGRPWSLTRDLLTSPRDLIEKWRDMQLWIVG